MYVEREEREKEERERHCVRACVYVCTARTNTARMQRTDAVEGKFELLLSPLARHDRQRRDGDRRGGGGGGGWNNRVRASVSTII